MSWRLVPAAVTLRQQVNDRWPNRDKRSDGSIGDAAHASRASDHNPDADGWVHAIDLDEDLGEVGAMRRLADELAAYCRARRPGSERIKNLVYEDQVCSGTYASSFWTWRGSGYGHQHHLHISFTNAAERDGSPFPLPILEGDDAMAISKDDAETIAQAVWSVKRDTYPDRSTYGLLVDVRRLAEAVRNDQAAPAPLQPTIGLGDQLELDKLAEQLADKVADKLAQRLQG